MQIIEIRKKIGDNKINMYGFLMAFTHGTTPCHSHLSHKYGEELINETLENGYITPIGETPDGETKYIITETGIAFRDN